MGARAAGRPQGQGIKAGSGRRRTARRAGLIATAAALAALMAPGAAQALTCGQTIKKDIKLHANLTCTSATNGLNVGRHDVTINLNGHTLTGSGHADNKYGVYSNGHDRVSVINGTVKNFHVNVYFDGAAKPVARNLRLIGDGTQDAFGLEADTSNGGSFSGIVARNFDSAVYLTDGGPNRLTKARITDSGFGVYMAQESYDRISNVRIFDGPGSATGISEYWSFRSIFANVTVKGSGYQYGIESRYPIDTLITDSLLRGTSDTGVYIHDNDPTANYHATIRRTTALNNGSYGLYSEENGTDGANNIVRGSPYTCFQVSCN